MFHLRLRSLGSTVLLAMLGIGVIATLAFSLMMYNTQSASEKDELANISEAVMQPIIGLATRGVSGNNILKLRGKDAQAIYQSSGVLYLKISGTSLGKPKNAFSKALPPTPISYEYVANGTNLDQIKAVAAGVEQSQFNDEQWRYIAYSDLKDVKNGGQIVAVFSSESLRGSVLRTLKSVGLVSLIVFLITLVCAVFFGRLISRPVVAISAEIKGISDSLDLSRRVSVKMRNEVGDTAQAFNTLVERLQQVIGEVEHSSGQLGHSVGDINHATQKINHRVQEQKQKTHTVSSAMTQMASVVDEVAQHAEAAAEAAVSTNQEASNGKTVVGQTIKVINQLFEEVTNASEVVQDLGVEAQNIGGVLDVIRGIAEQTNLLALNAAIEAARAGESGRGFAVVADEVRTLASRTQQSTEEIQGMIERLQSGATNADKAMEKGRKEVTAAVEQASAAGQSLAAITTSVDDISTMSGQIANSVKAQASVAEEINTNLAGIDELTESAAQDAEQSTHTSEQLSEISEHLKGLISQFRS